MIGHARLRIIGLTAHHLVLMDVQSAIEAQVLVVLLPSKFVVHEEPMLEGGLQLVVAELNV